MCSSSNTKNWSPWAARTSCRSRGRVSDHRPDALAAAVPEDVIDDRDDVREALAGPGAGGEHVREPGAGDPDRLRLVPVEPERPAVRVGPGLHPEHVPALGVEDPGGDQVVDPVARLERRVVLDQRLGPEHAGFELVLDEPAEPRLADGEEAAGVPGVVVDEAAAEVEDVHRRSVIVPARLQAARAAHCSAVLNEGALYPTRYPDDPQLVSTASRAGTEAHGVSGGVG